MQPMLLPLPKMPTSMTWDSMQATLLPRPAGSLPMAGCKMMGRLAVRMQGHPLCLVPSIP